MAMRKLYRRSLRVLAWLSVVAALVLIFVPWLAGWLLAGRLERMVQCQLNARVELSRVSYLPPYTIHVGEASLVTDGPDGRAESLLHVKSIKLKLAENPFTSTGPLVIESLEIDQPTIRLIETADGLLGSKGLVRAPSQRTGKLSEMFRLRHLGINSGEIEYQDRTSAAAGSVPMVWRGINIDLKTSQQSASLYGYQFSAANPPIATIDSTGTFDIDDLLIKAEKLSLVARAGAKDSESVLPPAIQTLLARYQVEGELAVEGSGTVPLEHIGQSQYEATVQVRRGVAYVPEADATLDSLAMRAKVQSSAVAGIVDPGTPASPMPATGPHRIKITLEQLEAASGDNAIKITNATADLIPGVGWLVPGGQGMIELGTSQANPSRGSHELLGKLDLSGKAMFGFLGSGSFDRRSAAPTRWSITIIPQGLSVRPPEFPERIQDIRGGIITATEAGIVIKEITGRYGRDLIVVDKATIPLKGIDRRIDLYGLAGSVTFAAASAKYPPNFERILTALHPSGRIAFAGTYLIPLSGPDDYDLVIQSKTAGLELTAQRISLTDVAMKARVRPEIVDVQDFQAAAFAGRVAGKGRITIPRPTGDVPGQPAKYDVEVAAIGVDLRDVMRNYLPPEKASKIVGKGYLSAKVAGSAGPGVDPLATATARGQFEILEGQFWEGPVLSGIRGHFKVADDLLAGSQAAGRFEIADRMVTLKRVAVSSPAIGLQGRGTVNFDGALKLEVIAAPLADWKANMKKTGIPIVSDVAGEIVGAMQKVINTATQNLLYEFRISGTIQEPDIKTVPAPALTDSAAVLFGHMLKGEKRLIDWLGENGDKK